MIPDLNARMAALQDEDEALLERRDAAVTDSFLRGMLGHVPPQWNGGLQKTMSTSTVPSSTTCTSHLTALPAPRVVVQTTLPPSSSTCTTAKTSSSSTCTTTTPSPVHTSTTCTTSKSITPVAVSTSTPRTTSTHTNTSCTSKTSSSALHTSTTARTSTTCTTKSTAVPVKTSTTCTTKTSTAATHTSTSCTTSAKSSAKSTSTCTTYPSNSSITAKTTSICTSTHATTSYTLTHSTVATASPSKSVVPVLPVSLDKCSSCPAANNTVYRDHSSTAYNIRCNADNSAESYHTLSVGEGGYSQCFSWCSADKTCSGFTFSGGDGGLCYYKKDLPSKLYINKRLDNYITCAKQTQHLSRRQLPYLDSDSHFVESLSVIALVVFLVVAFLAWLRRRRRAQSKDYVRSHSHRRTVSSSSDEHAPIALPFHELAGGEGFVAVPPYRSAYAVPKHAKKDSQGNSVSVQPQPAQHHARQRSIYKGDGGSL